MTLRNEYHEFFPKKKHSGAYGIEIETETLNYQDYPDGFLMALDEDEKEYDVANLPAWKGVTDHSLRDFGIEYVLRRPLDYNEAITAIYDFGKATGGIEFLKDTPSTSVHVHVNMLDVEISEIATFVTLWVLFENILVNYSGPSRRSNLFALPIRCSEGIATKFSRIFIGLSKGDPSEIINTSENSHKYGAINPCPLFRLGSIEIRCFRGETDPRPIANWLSIIDRMKRFSIGKVPTDITEGWATDGMTFFERVFGEYSFSLIEGIKDPRALIEKNLFHAAFSIAGCIPEWTTIDTAYSMKASGPKKIPKKSVGGWSVNTVQLDEYVHMVSASVPPAQTIMIDEYVPANDWLEPAEGEF